MNQKVSTSILAVIVVILLGGLLVYYFLVRQPELHQNIEVPKTIITLPVGGSGSAANLQAKVKCSDTELRKGIAELSWTVATETGSEQRVVVTAFRDGFESGKFEISESLPPYQSSLVWNKLEGQTIHLWRILTLHANGWVVSETSEFEGPSCVADFVE